MDNLRKLRQDRGLSQKELGKAMGVSQQTINKYETDKTEPDFRMLMALAEFFHTSVDHLIGYTDNPIPNRELVEPSVKENIDPASADPWRIKQEQNPSAQALRETSKDSLSLFDTTPVERHHLTMYRKLTPGMQFYLDSLLECIAPDDTYTEFRKPLE